MFKMERILMRHNCALVAQIMAKFLGFGSMKQNFQIYTAQIQLSYFPFLWESLHL